MNYFLDILTKLSSLTVSRTSNACTILSIHLKSRKKGDFPCCGGKRERKSRGRGRPRSTEKKEKSCVVQNTPEACCARYSRWEQSSGRLSLLLRLWRGVSKSCSHTLSSPLARASAGQVFSPRGLSLISLTLSFHCPINYTVLTAPGLILKMTV